MTYYRKQPRADGRWDVVALLTDEVMGPYTTEAEADALIDRMTNHVATTLAAVESLFHRGPRQ